MGVPPPVSGTPHIVGLLMLFVHGTTHERTQVQAIQEVLDLASGFKFLGRKSESKGNFG